jgi:uncharacterized membrane protein
VDAVALPAPLELNVLADGLFHVAALVALTGTVILRVEWRRGPWRAAFLGTAEQLQAATVTTLRAARRPSNIAS